MKGMSSLDMDLIQHDTTESARLHVIWRYESSDARRNIRQKTIPSITWRQLRGSPAHFSFCTFPTSAVPHRTHKHSSSNMYKNNNRGPISCQNAAPGQTFSSCGRLAEGRSVLEFTTGCPCTDSTRVVMQEESSLEPLAENHCLRCVGA